MDLHLPSLIHYFAAHAGLALGAVFLGSLLEALALVGTFIPGSSMVFIAGVLIGLQVLDPWWTVAASVCGAILGDGASYWLGHHYRQELRLKWPMRDYPQVLDRGEAYFREHGGKSIFLGRFLGPVRAVVPVIAGMSGMPATRFYLVNVVSAFAWAGAHLLPGALFGASLQLAGAVSSRLAVIALVIGVALWAIATAVRLALAQLPRLASLRDRIVQHLRRHSGFVARHALALFDPTRAEATALLTAAIVLAGSGWLFFGVLQDVIARDPLVAFDRSVYAVLQAVRSAWVDEAMVYITELGGTAATVSIVVVMSLLLALNKRWRTLGYWLGGVSVAELLVSAIQAAMTRARPNPMYTGAAQYSFPSGHTTLAVVVYGFLAFVLARGKARPVQVALAVVTATAIALIAFSRLYLGAHWFSDVVASTSLGVAWVSLLSIAHLHHVRNGSVPVRVSAAVVLATLLVVDGVYVRSRYADEIARYSHAPHTQTISAGAWTADAWRQLPAARSELGGDREEPFALQWAGTAAEIAGALAAAGWERARPWGAKATLLWLLPTATLEELPVLPKFDHGEPQMLTVVKNLDGQRRIVVRLWPSSFVVRDDTPAAPVPLWYGMVTIERLVRFRSWITLTKTDSNFAAAEQIAEQDVRLAHLAMQQREGGGMTVLLISRSR